MKKKLIIVFTVLSVVINFGCLALGNLEKPRILILTDIENEPDDAESLVRFLLYANQFDASN